MAKPTVHVGHTLASPRYDKEDEIKLEALGYTQARGAKAHAGASRLSAWPDYAIAGAAARDGPHW